jgi:hypothetical protein
VLVADAGADTPKTILADGPEYSEEELEEIRETAVRAISPFAPAERLNGVPAEPIARSATVRTSRRCSCRSSATPTTRR